MAAESDCTFCRIVSGELEAEIVFSDDRFRAFLDARPLFPGHLLLVPRDHHETLEDLPGELAGPFLERGQALSAAVRTAMGAQGTFVAINNKVSQSVPHLHLHIVPRNRKDGLRGFFWPRNPYRDDAEMAAAGAAIRAALAAG